MELAEKIWERAKTERGFWADVGEERDEAGWNRLSKRYVLALLAFGLLLLCCFLCYLFLMSIVLSVV